jgi:hypothetical protein
MPFTCLAIGAAVLVACSPEQTRLQSQVESDCWELASIVERAWGFAPGGGFHVEEGRPEHRGFPYLLNEPANLRRAALLCLDTRDMWAEAELRRAALRDVILRETARLESYTWGDMGPEELTEVLQSIHVALREILTYPSIR